MLVSIAEPATRLSRLLDDRLTPCKLQHPYAIVTYAQHARST